MMVAATRCLILSPISCTSYSSTSSALWLPRISLTRRRSLSCSSSSPFDVLASMDAPPQGYRTNVGIYLADPSLTKIFSASRIDIPTAWQMPQGGIDGGEEPRAAAVRELREETGVTSAEIVAEAPNWLTYDFPPDVRDKLNARWGTTGKARLRNDLALDFAIYQKLEGSFQGRPPGSYEFVGFTFLAAAEGTAKNECLKHSWILKPCAEGDATSSSPSQKQEGELKTDSSDG